MIKISEYDQEIQQSHTADLEEEQQSHRLLTVTRHQEDNQSKQQAQDDCKTGKDTKYCKPRKAPNTQPH